MMPPTRGEHLPEATLGPFGLTEVKRYAAASGDSNPIHVDHSAAAAAGLAGPIVQGMLVMAHMIRIAEAWRADAVVTMARVLFVRPIGVGEKLAVEGRIVAHQRATPAWQCTLRLTARNDAGTLTAIVEVRMLESGTSSSCAGNQLNF